MIYASVWNYVLQLSSASWLIRGGGVRFSSSEKFVLAFMCSIFFLIVLFFFFNFIYLFIYLFMAVLDLPSSARAFSSCGKRGPLFIAVRGPLTIAASLSAEHRSRRAGSVIVAHGPICSMACRIFPDQGSNPCPLHWQADSQLLRHQGSPFIVPFYM